jgi:hypothetical protein
VADWSITVIRNTDHLTWVLEKMPEACALALAKFTQINPHWRGANWDDCLDTLIDSDSHLDLTEPLYDAVKETPYEYRRCESVAITMLYSSQSFAESKLADQITQVIYTVGSLS